MSIQGYSYYQKGRLDALAAEVGKKSGEVEKKVARNDYLNEINSLDQKDASHFTSINNLKIVRLY